MRDGHSIIDVETIKQLMAGKNRYNKLLWLQLTMKKHLTKNTQQSQQQEQGINPNYLKVIKKVYKNCTAIIQLYKDR